MGTSESSVRGGPTELVNGPASALAARTPVVTSVTRGPRHCVGATDHFDLQPRIGFRFWEISHRGGGAAEGQCVARPLPGCGGSWEGGTQPVPAAEWRRGTHRRLHTDLLLTRHPWSTPDASPLKMPLK